MNNLSTSAPAAQPSRVLVIDPYPDSADSLATLLRFLGFDARTAFGVKHGCEVAADFQPRFVITETFCMGMRRSELVRCLREVAPHATLIELTTTPAKTDVAGSEAADFAFHLVKPPDPERILDALATTGETHRFLE